MNTTIEINNLNTGYKIKGGNKIISSNLNAKLYNNELTCLLGPNGSGKSTLLRTLSAFQPSMGGRVKIMDRELSAYSSKELARLISVVLTDNSGIKNMTAEEVVAMVQEMARQPVKVIRDRRLVQELQDRVLKVVRCHYTEDCLREVSLAETLRRS